MGKYDGIGDVQSKGSFLYFDKYGSFEGVVNRFHEKDIDKGNGAETHVILEIMITKSDNDEVKVGDIRNMITNEKAPHNYFLKNIKSWIHTISGCGEGEVTGERTQLCLGDKQPLRGLGVSVVVERTAHKTDPNKDGYPKTVLRNRTASDDESDTLPSLND